jgi:hypothetical protein
MPQAMTMMNLRLSLYLNRVLFIPASTDIIGPAITMAQ